MKKLLSMFTTNKQQKYLKEVDKVCNKLDELQEKAMKIGGYKK